MRRMSLFATAAALAVLPALKDAAAAPTCDPARVMVLFDRSTSMDRGFINGDSKWDLATGALEGLVHDYQSQTAFGLAIFPEDAGTCKSGAKVVVDPPARNTLTPISNALVTYNPGTNHWTPIGQAVKEMVTLPSMGDTTKRRYLILVTDGAQSCPTGANGNPNETTEIWGTQKIVEQVTALKGKGVTVFIIGFGAKTSGSGDDGVDAYTLNQMAVAGGTAIRSCDSNSRDPAADNNCYYQADNDDELSAAFEEIALIVNEETCNGQDDDCDGQVDEDLNQDCSSACGPGSQKCTNGTWGMCTATQPKPEVCDGQDNNCNNVVDEGCACKNGETKPCGKDTGECELGLQTCVNGQWSACVGGKGPSAEVCDGLDNNCDGFADPDCDCVDGTEKSCGGPEVGKCKAGVQKCVNGAWGTCNGAIGPSAEECNGIDDDCDGMIDEGAPLGEDDDLSNGLCGAGMVCESGHCVGVPTGNNPPPGVVPSGEPAGCGCRTSGSTSTDAGSLGGLLLALCLGAVFLRRRQ